MKSENESREESYQEMVKLLEASLKPDPSFRSLGDLLSDGAFMIPLAPPGRVPSKKQPSGPLSGVSVRPRA
jgi:hypothetical protein